MFERYCGLILCLASRAELTSDSMSFRVTEENQSVSSDIKIVALALAPNNKDVRSTSLSELARQPNFVRCCRVIVRLREERKLGSRVSGSLLQRYEDAELAFQQFVATWLDRIQGVSIPKLRRAHGGRINNWLYDDIPGELAHLDPESRSMSVDVGAKLVGTNPKLAFLLGATASRVRPGFAGRSLQLRIGDCQKAAVLRSSLLELREFLGVCSKAADPKGTTIELGYAISAYFAVATEANTRLPWMHLSTTEERSAFIRGFITYSGISIRPNKPVTLQRRHGACLLRDLTALLLMEGVIGAFVSSGGGGAVIVSDQASRVRLLEVLAEVPHSSRSPRSSMHDLFTRAKELAGAGMPVYKIQAALEHEFGCDFSHATISGWGKGVVPIVVQNEEYARAVLREVFQKFDFAALGRRWLYDFKIDKTITLQAMYHRFLGFFGDLCEVERLLPNTREIVKTLRESSEPPNSKQLTDFFAHFGINLSLNDLNRK